MMVLIRSQDTHTDSRLGKYLKIIDEAGIASEVISWRREGEMRESTCRKYDYIKLSTVGAGYANAFAIFGWNFHILRVLFKLRHKYSVIHVVDLDSVLPTLLFKLFFSKRIVFDVYDKYSDSRNIGAPISKLVDFVERFAATTADQLLLPDACRISQLGVGDGNVTVLENVPAYSELGLEDSRNRNECLTLGYVGVLEAKHRGIEDLLEVVSRNPAVRLRIAGVGPLRDMVVDFAARFDNIDYHGPVVHQEALEILASCNVMVGLYYRSNRNHFYAAPNKYYEHLLLGMPLITTVGTPPGNKVLEGNTGYALIEGSEALQRWIDEFNQNEVAVKSLNARKLWRSKYENYFNSHFKPCYLHAIGC